MYNKNEILFLSENTFFNNIYFLSQGVFIAAICSFYGFSALFSTAILAFPIIFVNLQLFSSIFFEKSKNKKKYILFINAISKLFLSLSFISVYFSNLGAVIFFVLYVLGHTFYNLSLPAIDQWMVNSITEKSRSTYFAAREFLFLLTFTFVNLFAVQFINDATKMQEGFTKLFAMLFIFSVISFFSLLSIKTDFGLNKEKLMLKKIITMPFKHKRFSKILIFLSLLNFSLWFSVSFSNVYLIQLLQLNITWIVTIKAIGFFFRSIIIPVFNKIAGVKGWRLIIFFGIVSMVFSQFLWIFVNIGNSLLMYAFIVMLQNIAFGSLGAGVYIAQLFNMPTLNKNIYFSASGFISGISGTLSVIISLIMVYLFVPSGLNIIGINIPYYIIIFGINCVMYIVTAVYFVLKINIMKLNTYNLALKTETEFLSKIQ